MSRKCLGLCSKHGALAPLDWCALGSLGRPLGDMWRRYRQHVSDVSKVDNIWYHLIIKHGNYKITSFLFIIIFRIKYIIRCFFVFSDLLIQTWWFSMLHYQVVSHIRYLPMFLSFFAATLFRGQQVVQDPHLKATGDTTMFFSRSDDLINLLIKLLSCVNWTAEWTHNDVELLNRFLRSYS